MKYNIIIFSIFCALLASCGVESAKFSSLVLPTPTPGVAQPGARIIFHQNSFTWLDTYNGTTLTTSYKCPGDMLKVYSAESGDYTGVLTRNSSNVPAVPLDAQTASDDLAPTVKPSFLKHASVDITNSYYIEGQANGIQSDVCSYRSIASAALPDYCADFDRYPFLPANEVTAGQSGTPTPAPSPLAATTPTPSPTPDWSGTAGLDPFFGSGFFRVRDDWCSYQGPIIDPDISVTKSHVGGANIDLDRNELGANEDVLINITYHAFNGGTYPNEWPNLVGSTNPPDHHTVLKVQMIGTNQTLDTLLGMKQPRAWGYYDSNSYPVYAKDITTLDDPQGGLRTEQVYVPLSKYPLVDRIRIERVRGTYILYEVAVYKMGERSETIE